jgi:hypothetical protein
MEGKGSEEDRQTNAGSWVDQVTDTDKDPKRQDKSGWYGVGGQDEKVRGIINPWKASQPDVPGFQHDQPGGTVALTAPETFTAETAIVIKSGTLAGKVCAVVTWGYEADANGAVTALTPHFSLTETAEFDAAIKKWNEQALIRVGVQDPLPLLAGPLSL